MLECVRSDVPSSLVDSALSLALLFLVLRANIFGDFSELRNVVSSPHQRAL